MRFLILLRTGTAVMPAFMEKEPITEQWAVPLWIQIICPFTDRHCHALLLRYDSKHKTYIYQED
jgi:hypothetical protein